MAMCEVCSKSGYLPEFMSIRDQIFVGPCCQTSSDLPVNFRRGPQIINLPIKPDDVEYGFELSNKAGVKAYATYGGLSLQFERSPSQIRRWMEENDLIDKKRHA